MSLRALLNKFRRATYRRGYTCDCCGREVFAYPAERLCKQCEEKLLKNDRFVCDKCGRKTVTEGVCNACKRNLPRFDGGASPYVYHGHTAALVNEMKNGNRRLACFFAEKMAETFLFVKEKWGLSEAEWLAVPVPTTAEKRCLRGYNPSEELLIELSAALCAQGEILPVDLDVLIKRRETSQQKHLSAKERMENVKGAYHVRKRVECRGKTVLLVDDILTTGATGSECARLLLAAGAKKVLILTAAALPERR